MRDRRTYLRSLAAISATVAVAGCSGNGDGNDGSDGQGGADGGDATPTETPASTPTEAPASTPIGTETGTQMDPAGTTSSGGATAQSEYPDYSWGQLDGVEATDATTVTITGFAYDPIVARVPAGATVSFPNEDSAPHTVTAPDLGVDNRVGGGGETSVTVEEPGTYDYVCRFHPPDMLGRLVVEES
jgi:plastocyanin